MSISFDYTLISLLLSVAIVALGLFSIGEKSLSFEGIARFIGFISAWLVVGVTVAALFWFLLKALSLLQIYEATLTLNIINLALSLALAFGFVRLVKKNPSES